MTTTNPPVAKRSAGRPGLTRKDVAGAFEALAERGMADPSLLQLREHLGRGSNTTIARLRQEIRGEQLLATRTPVAGSLEASVLPVLVAAMERLGEEAAKAADGHIEAMRGEFEATTRTMVHARDEAEQTLRDMRLEYHAREGQIRDAKERIKSLEQMLSEERGRWDRARAALEAQSTKAHASERQAREEAARTEAQRDSLEARLSDAHRVIDSLAGRVNDSPNSISR